MVLAFEVPTLESVGDERRDSATNGTFRTMRNYPCAKLQPWEYAYVCDRIKVLIPFEVVKGIRCVAGHRDRMVILFPWQ
jgi:hypothetical protein